MRYWVHADTFDIDDLSAGARLERAVAEAIGIPCAELGELGGE